MTVVHSRKVVGWAIDTRHTTNLVLNVRDMAVEARNPSQTEIHSDHQAQFTSWAFTSRIRGAGLIGSMGTIVYGYGKAMIESFRETMHVKLLNRKKWRTRLELANAIFEYFEYYYNRSRRHLALNGESPAAFEAQGRQQKIST